MHLAKHPIFYCKLSKSGPANQYLHLGHSSAVEPRLTITPLPRDAKASATAASSIPESLPPPPPPPPSARWRRARASSRDGGSALSPRPEGLRRCRSRRHAT